MASFGKLLRTERELRGIRLEEIAQATKISLRFLEYIEHDCLERLPGGVFPRAFVRQYASYLGLDTEKIVSEFVYYTQGSAAPPTTPPQKERRDHLLLALGVIVALMISGGAWLLLRSAKPKRDPTPALPAFMPTTPETEEVYVGVQEAKKGLVMKLEAKEDCWIEARVDGQVVVNRVLNSGETATLEAMGEIRLSVGNAGGLAFQVNDRPGLPLGRSGEVKRDIRITRENLSSLIEANETPQNSLSG